MVKIYRLLEKLHGFMMIILLVEDVLSDLQVVLIMYNGLLFSWKYFRSLHMPFQDNGIKVNIIIIISIIAIIFTIIIIIISV